VRLTGSTAVRITLLQLIIRTGVGLTVRELCSTSRGSSRWAVPKPITPRVALSLEPRESIRHGW